MKLYISLEYLSIYFNAILNKYLMRNEDILRHDFIKVLLLEITNFVLRV